MSCRSPRAPAPDLERERLERAILDAHGAGDLARLAALYARAGAREAEAARIDAACFFWTQAWIYALDAGDQPLARDLERRLREAGRLGLRTTQANDPPG